MLGDDIYGVSLPREVADHLLSQGLVEWMPPKFGTSMYAITDAGCETLKWHWVCETLAEVVHRKGKS
jgi:hypothetical protein